jgi:thiol-disulfide isomerase/thioredoxin
MERGMSLLRIVTFISALLLLTATARSELSVVLELPEELGADILPPFSAKDKDAENGFQRRHLEKTVADAPKTKRVALVYFATWCKPCAEGAAKLKKARKVLKENGVMVILVNVGEKEPEPVHKWIKDYGDPKLPLIMDTKSQLAERCGLTGADGVVIMPKTLVLDAKLKPLFLLGTEGDDFPEILWKRKQ